MDLATKIIIVLALVIIAMVFVAWAFADIEINQDIDEPGDAERNRAWHWKKAVFLGFLFAAIAISLFDITIEMGAFVLALASLNVVVFNPCINLFKDKIRKGKFKGGFFYLGNEGPESWFAERGAEKLYYFGFLLFFIGMLIFIYFRL